MAHGAESMEHGAKRKAQKGKGALRPSGIVKGIPPQYDHLTYGAGAVNLRSVPQGGI